MDTYSEIINEFNSTFSTNASLCEDLKVGWDWEIVGLLLYTS